MRFRKNKKRTNKLAIILGIVLIISFVITVRYTYILREIRVNGELIYTPIVSISYAAQGGNSAKVLIEGKELSAGSISNKLKVDDIIAVRYIKGKSDVVQERVELWRFYLWFGLESVLLILGGFLIVGGFMGKR